MHPDLEQKKPQKRRWRSLYRKNFSKGEWDIYSICYSTSWNLQEETGLVLGEGIPGGQAENIMALD